jgi:thiamine biosynthesis lipoprotein
MSEAVSIKQRHMNCQWEIKAFPQPFFSKEQTEALINEAFEHVKRIELKYTEFQKSVITSINKTAYDRDVSIDQETLMLLRLAQSFYAQTDGVFDITFRSDEGISFRDVLIDESNMTIRFTKLGTRLSLGGLGKGYAVDEAFNFLKDQGLVNFMVNGSGDIRVHSHENAQRPWRLGITNPLNPSNTMGMVNLTNHAMATSGTYIKPGHIRTKTNDHPLSVTVITKTAVTADFLGTYLMAMPVMDAIKYLNAKNIYGVVTTADGKCYSSQQALGAQERFKENQNA